MNGKFRCALAVLVSTVLFASAALAQDGEGRAYGLRLGYGMDPDQFVAGLQADMGSIYRNIHFVPSIDGGFGDHVTTLSFNADFKGFLPLPKSSVAFYGLAGPTLTYWMLDEVDDDLEIGLSLGVGARIAFGDSGWYNVEARFGAGDIPEFKILMGLLFGQR